ncbi:hypothetical protein CR513_20012, partial [Mucuna pruriens]
MIHEPLKMSLHQLTGLNLGVFDLPPIEGGGNEQSTHAKVTSGIVATKILSDTSTHSPLSHQMESNALVNCDFLSLSSLWSQWLGPKPEHASSLWKVTIIGLGACYIYIYNIISSTLKKRKQQDLKQIAPIGPSIP